MAGFRRYEDIEAWKLSAELRDRIVDWSGSGPVSRDFQFRDQVRDASSSAPRNIAEGFGRFRPREFAYYARIARGSLLETRNHLQDARTRGYIDEAVFSNLLALTARSVGALTNLIKYLESCGDEFPTGAAQSVEGHPPARRRRTTTKPEPGT
jgi:four helix bundle protein